MTDEKSTTPDPFAEGEDVTDTPPKQASTSDDNEVFTVSGGMINMIVVALLFFFVGIAVGGVFFGGDSEAVDESTLRIVLNETLAELNEALAEVGSAPAAQIQTVDYLEDDDPFLGPEDAPVVIVEFSDFLCSFCGRHFQQTLQPLLEEYDGYIRYVYRDFPGVGGDFAYISAMGAECAYDQEAFWEFHDLLFNNQQSLASDNIENILVGFAEDLELDIPTFTTCLQEQEHLGDVVLDRADGASLGMNGTPGFLINGRYLSGAQPFDTFVIYIEDALDRAGVVRGEDNTSPDLGDEETTTEDSDA